MKRAKEQQIVFRSVADVEKYAQEKVSELTAGETWLLHGDLGSGKTTFVQAVGKGLSIAETITSPTFVVVKTYGTTHAVIRKLVHADLYRVHAATDAQALGLEEAINDPEALVCIEWPEVYVFPTDLLVRRFHFTILSPGVHCLTVDARQTFDLQ